MAVPSTFYKLLLAHTLKSQLWLFLFPFCQDFRNSQARNAEGGLEAFHWPLPPEEHPVPGSTGASSIAVRACPTRHQSHGGKRDKAKTVKHRNAHSKNSKYGLWWKNKTNWNNRRPFNTKTQTYCVTYKGNKEMKMWLNLPVCLGVSLYNKERFLHLKVIDSLRHTPAFKG